MEPLQIESITFSNFKALVNTTLPLGRFTLIVGPNGSGKSTALQGIECLKRISAPTAEINRLQTAKSAGNDAAMPALGVKWLGPLSEFQVRLRWIRSQNVSLEVLHSHGHGITPENRDTLLTFLRGLRVYALDAVRVAEAVNLTPNAELSRDGSGLAVVLDRMRDEFPERFNGLNDEFGRCLPEFDRILFETPSEGKRAIRLRTRTGGHLIPASELSQGTLLALAMLTLAHLPNPPSLIGLEEPDRGIHPRLLRDVRDSSTDSPTPKTSARRGPRYR